MARELPSLNAVRMFEAAAYRLNFTEAAKDLHVTQGAVSRQISLLEEQIGTALFERRGPKLSLSHAGMEYYEVIKESLNLLRRGTVRLQQRANTKRLTISLVPSFARFWLLPRIGEVEKVLPDVSIRLATSYHLVDFDKDTDVDVAIRFGDGNWPDIFTHQLTNDFMVPVCSPALAKSIKSIEDIPNYPMIADYPKKNNEWTQWFESKGLQIESQAGWQYDDIALQIEAAIEGRGVLLVRESFVESSLLTGRLVQLFESDYRSRYQYYFVCPQERLNDSLISDFFDWIKQAIQKKK